MQLLPKLYGGPEVLKRARHDLPLLPGVVAALDALQVLVDGQPNVDFGVDLADVDGYGYHSGIKFALYAEGWRDALVRGGRYDDVSLAFGRARPATGFSLDLRKLAAGLPPAERARAVRAPWGKPPPWSRRSAACAGQGKSSFRYCPVTSRIRTNSFAIASWRCRMAPGRSERCD